MAITNIPTRTTADPNASSDVNTLNDNDQDLQGQITAIPSITNLQNASTGLYRNAIINPIDDSMIDQYSTGAVTVANDAYVIDRWKVSEGGTNPTFNKGTNTIGLTSGATETSKNALWQEIEDVNYDRLASKEITVSAIVTADDSDCRLIVTDDGGSTWNVSTVHGGGGGEETLSTTFTVNSSATSLNVYIGYQSITQGTVSITTGKLFTFKHAQLTLGDTVLPYQPKIYSQVEAECQYYKLSVLAGDTDSVFTNGGAESSNDFTGFIKFPVSMRTHGYSFSYSNLTHFAVREISGTLRAITALSVTGRTREGCLMQATVSGTLTNGFIGKLVANSTASARLNFDDEL